MALEDTVNEDLDTDDEDEEESDSDEDAGGGGGFGGGSAPAPMSPLLQARSDELFKNSFGEGSFTPNEFGGMTFTPKPEASKQAPTNPAAIDPNTMGLQAASPTGRQQIRNLKQLAAVAKRIKGLPQQWQNRILAHLFGVGYQDPQSQQLQRALTTAAYRSQLQDPYKQAAAKRGEAGLMLRAQGLDARLKDMQDKQQRAKATLDFRRQNAKSMRELHHMTAYNALSNSIARNTKAAESAPDEVTRQNILAHIAKQHKLAEKYEKMFLPEEDENGGGESATAGQTY
jgi:hypothetical protein